MSDDLDRADVRSMIDQLSEAGVTSLVSRGVPGDKFRAMDLSHVRSRHDVLIIFWEHGVVSREEVTAIWTKEQRGRAN